MKSKKERARYSTIERNASRQQLYFHLKFRLTKFPLCVTTTLQLLLSIMAVVCAKLALLVMMHHVLYFHRLLVDHAIKVLWSVWDKKIHMLVMKHNQNVVFSLSNIPLNMVLLLTGMIWKKSGIIHSTMNFVLHLKNIQFFLLKHH